MEGHHLGGCDLKGWDILGWARSAYKLLYDPAIRHTTTSTSPGVVEVRQGTITVSPINQQQSVSEFLTKAFPHRARAALVSSSNPKGLFEGAPYNPQ
jgi:hypothetical protein